MTISLTIKLSVYLMGTSLLNFHFLIKCKCLRYFSLITTFYLYVILHVTKLNICPLMLSIYFILDTVIIGNQLTNLMILFFIIIKKIINNNKKIY